VGVNANNKAYFIHDGLPLEFLTLEGIDNWYATEVISKTVEQSDFLLGSIIKGRFKKPDGTIVEHGYDIYYSPSLNGAFIAREGVHVNATTSATAIKANWAEFKGYTSNTWNRLNPHTNNEMFNHQSGGYAVSHNQHNVIIGNVDSKAEFTMAEAFANNGEKVELLNENLGNGIPTPDAKILDYGIFDFKNISASATNIENNVRNKIKDVGRQADNIAFNLGDNPLVTPERFNVGVLDALKTPGQQPTYIGVVYKNGKVKILSTQEILSGKRF
jgi:hypothetical protein